MNWFTGGGTKAPPIYSMNLVEQNVKDLLNKLVISLYLDKKKALQGPK